MSEHQNGSMSLKHCDNKSAVTSVAAEIKKLKPVAKSFDHMDNSNRSAQDPLKLSQIEIPARVPSTQSGFTVPLPPETKIKTEKPHALPALHDQKKTKIEQQTWPLTSHPHQVNSIQKLEGPYKHYNNYSQMTSVIDSKQFIPPKVSDPIPFAISYHNDSKRDEYVKEKLPKEHKKEKSKHYEESEHKHKKKSKHNRDFKEEHSKKVLPVKIKLPSLVSSNSTEEFKLRIKEIPKPDDKMIENTINSEPIKERLTMKIGKDMHGNFYQQTQFNVPMGPEISNLSESSNEHPKKRKSEQSSSSKKSRHDRGRHDDVHSNLTSLSMTLPSDLNPTSFPPQF